MQYADHKYQVISMNTHACVYVCVYVYKINAFTKWTGNSNMHKSTDIVNASLKCSYVLFN